MSNPHTQIAQLRAAGVHEWQSEEGSTDATNIAAAIDAQTESTLALAYEQRTANLIAVWQTGEVKSDGAVYGIMPDLRMKVWLEIADRLGLS